MSKKNILIQTLNRPYPPFYISLIFEGYKSSVSWEKFLGFKQPCPDRLYIDGDWYYPKIYLENFSKKIFNNLLNNKKIFEQIKKKSQQREKKLLGAVNKDFELFCAAYQWYMPTLGIFFICDDLIEDKVRKLLNKKLNSQKIESLINYLITPYQNNFNRQAQIDLVNTKNLDNYLKKYSWLRSRYGIIRPYTKQQVQNDLKKLKRENFKIKYNQDKKKIKQAVGQAKKILGKKQEHLIDIMQFFIYYRTQRTDIMNKVAYQYADKLKQIAKEKGVSYEQLLFCSYLEIKNNQIPSRQIIERRKRGVAVVLNKNGCFVYQGQKYKQLKKKFDKINLQASDITGKTAYPGKIKGRVRIIKKYSDLAKIKKGDILVTMMTTPEMVPTMHKAAGFITDEGGITCHAAILAREMKKPCLIATKVATKLLKDNSLIELDTDKGMIKKL